MYILNIGRIFSIPVDEIFPSSFSSSSAETNHTGGRTTYGSYLKVDYC